MREYIVGEESSLQNFTDEHDPQASFVLRTLLKNREVRVNGVKVDRNVPLQKGDCVQYFLTRAQEEKLAFSVLYEDENVVVVDKESGVQSEAVFCALQRTGETYFIHRLDRNTEGVMIFARNQRAESLLLDAFRNRHVQKRYHALVAGSVREEHAVKHAYLKKDERTASVAIYDRPCGEEIVTEYRVLERRGETTLLEVTLHTGKTHQIRAHLAHLGYPIVGDEKYGNSSFNRKAHATRQRLIAKSICISAEGELAYLKEKVLISPKNL